jgi:NitT/TauT family transport system ATP-binding protein
VRSALDDVSLEIREGELLVLVGTSGCGKTTVLNLLAGLITPSSGTVSVLRRQPVEARSHIAYMFARDALLPWRTARSNVEFALELRRPSLSKKARRAIAEQFLDELGVGASGGLYPWQLSQGMRQRVALARTWAIAPDLLLMDEPFAALDAQTRAATQQKFLDVWAADRRSVAFVTHELAEAVLLADRIVMMSQGRIVDEVEVHIARPRDPETIILDEGYRALYQRLVRALHSNTIAQSNETEIGA